jgi:hypothetical protein
MSSASVPIRSSWEEVYQQALVENDREKLTGLVGAVEVAIVRRRQELNSAAEGHSAEMEEHDKECAAMVLAAQEILRIKTEKLGWPGFSPNAQWKQNPDVVDKIRRVESTRHWHR